MTWTTFFLSFGLLAALSVIFYFGGTFLYALYKWASTR